MQADRIADLELKNKELEKFQYVLEYKKEELTRLIEPREKEIDRMRNQLLEVHYFLLFAVNKANLQYNIALIYLYCLIHLSLTNERKLNYIQTVYVSFIVVRVTCFSLINICVCTLSTKD